MVNDNPSQLINAASLNLQMNSIVVANDIPSPPPPSPSSPLSIEVFVGTETEDNPPDQVVSEPRSIEVVVETETEDNPPDQAVVEPPSIDVVVGTEREDNPPHQVVTEPPYIEVVFEAETEDNPPDQAVLEPPSIEVVVGMEIEDNSPDQAASESPANVPRPPHQRHTEWFSLFMNFCFNGVTITLQSNRASSSVHLRFSFQIAALGMVLTLAAFLVSKYIPENLEKLEKMLENVGLSCGVTGFLLCITPSISLGLKIISWIIYAVSLLAIIISHNFNIFRG